MSALPLFNIAVRLEILPALGAPVLVNNISGQGLRVEWSVEKIFGGIGDRATITVYNLGAPQRAALEAATAPIAGVIPVPPTIVRLHVGWNALPELLFMGGAWRIAPATKRELDILTEIEVGVGDDMRDTPPSGGAAVGLGVQGAIAEILVLLKLMPSAGAMAAIAQAAAEAPLANLETSVFDIEPRDQLHLLLASIGLNWGVQDGEFVVFRNGMRNDVLPVLLDPTSGLLNAVVLDDGGVAFDGVAQARLKPGVQLVITDERKAIVGGGALRCERISFNGSSEGPSVMSGVARKAAIL